MNLKRNHRNAKLGKYRNAERVTMSGSMIAVRKLSEREIQELQSYIDMLVRGSTRKVFRL